jgi:flagellar motor switch protein FliM
MAKGAMQAEMRMEGPERLLDSGGISLERMPMLNVIFDRIAMQVSEALRQLSTAPAYTNTNSIAMERIGTILDTFEGRVVVGVFHAQAWDARIMLALENKFVFTLIDALFGGDGSEAPYSEHRPLTNVEMRIAQKAFDVVVRALQVEFAEVGRTSFKFERIESRLDFAVIAPRASFAVVAGLNIRLLGRTGELFVVIPQAALKQMRQNLAHDATNEVAPPDPEWSKQIQNEVGRAEVTISAVIEEDGFTLGDIAALKVGQILQLQATPQSRVKLESNDQALFWCYLGQAGGLYTLKIDETFDSEQEFFDTLLK